NSVPIESPTIAAQQGAVASDTTAIDRELSDTGSVSSDQAGPLFSETVYDDQAPDLTWWFIFLQGFIGGFAALLTPCVFPMIPMNVSFFTKQSKTKSQGLRNALLYGIF